MNNLFKDDNGNYPEIEKELAKLAQDARELGYKVTTPDLFIDPVHGNKLAYYNHGTNKIVMHEQQDEDDWRDDCPQYKADQAEAIRDAKREGGCIDTLY